MPQFDSSYFSSQIFWLIVSFVPLYFFALKYYLPRIRNIISLRQKKNQENIDSSEQLKKRIEDLTKKILETKQSALNKQKLMISEAEKHISKYKFISVNRIKQYESNMNTQLEQEIQELISELNYKKELMIEDISKAIVTKISS